VSAYVAALEESDTDRAIADAFGGLFGISTSATGDEGMCTLGTKSLRSRQANTLATSHLVTHSSHRKSFPE
jgi:hypothetical protein